MSATKTYLSIATVSWSLSATISWSAFATAFVERCRGSHDVISALRLQRLGHEADPSSRMRLRQPKQRT